MKTSIKIFIGYLACVILLMGFCAWRTLRQQAKLRPMAEELCRKIDETTITTVIQRHGAHPDEDYAKGVTIRKPSDLIDSEFREVNLSHTRFEDGCLYLDNSSFPFD